MTEGRKIFYAINLAFFVTGLIMCFFSSYIIDAQNQRLIISGVLIGIAYIMFPFISMDKKDKIIVKLGLHLLAILLSFTCGYNALNYFLKNSSTNLIYDILASIGIIFLFSYLAYILISFIYSFYSICAKFINKILRFDVKEKYATIKSVLTALTAFLATLTAVVAGFSALISSVKDII